MSDLDQRRPYVRATVVSAQRPTSAKPGDTARVFGDGTIEGFVGGSCAETSVRMEALRSLATGDSVLLRVTPDPVSGPEDEPGHVTVSNPCLSGGALEIFLQPVLPRPLVHVFGDAPIARALADVGAAMGYEVQLVLDPAAGVAPDAAAVIVASHGRDEVAVLERALRAGVPYVGLVASRRRGTAVVAELDGGERVHTPAGLDIGAHSPGEVAVAILAEMVSTRPAIAVSARAEEPAAGAGVCDPVCGMSVATVASSLRVVHEGATYWFCGSGCLAAFLDDPARYV